MNTNKTNTNSKYNNMDNINSFKKIQLITNAKNPVKGTQFAKDKINGGYKAMSQTDRKTRISLTD